MATTQAEKSALSAQNGAGVIDLQKFREELSEAGQELFDIIFGTPDDPEDLLSQDEVLDEVARRRGGKVD